MKVTWAGTEFEFDDTLTPTGLFKHFGEMAIIHGAKASAAGQEAFGANFGETLGTEFGSRVGDATTKQIEKLAPTPENVSAAMAGLATNHMDLWTQMMANNNPMQSWLNMVGTMMGTHTPKDPAPGE